MITTKQTYQRMSARRHFAPIPFVLRIPRLSAELWMGKRSRKPPVHSCFASTVGNAALACTLKWLAIHHDNWLSRRALLLCCAYTPLRLLPRLGSLPRDFPLQSRSALLAQHPLIEEVDQQVTAKNAKREKNGYRHWKLSKIRTWSRLFNQRPKRRRGCDGKSLEVHQKFVKNQQARSMVSRSKHPLPGETVTRKDGPAPTEKFDTDLGLNRVKCLAAPERRSSARYSGKAPNNGLPIQ